ncbi:hypothetical protein [Streptosporangium sp. NPDC000396]|uniref:hypothetical protein n=1 Tax=Streptosporangium sp. NPDC000396 TaxID=3366185 RepID=UPI00368A6B70
MPAEVREDIWSGVSTLLDSYLHLSGGDRLAILYTPDCREPAAWVATVAAERGVHPTIVAMAPIEDDELPARLDEALHPAAVGTGRFVVLTIERHSMSHFAVLRDLQNRIGRERCDVARIIGGGADFFAIGMNATPDELSGYNASILSRLRSSKRITVSTELGTYLEIEFDHDRYTWTSNRGKLRKGSFLVLPAGEVATYPARINGRLVADAAFNANIYTEIDARLARSPVTVDVSDNEAVDYHCADPQVSRLIELCWSVPNARRVGELGFGTNAGVNRLVAMNSHINERVPGVHLGFGQHNQPVNLVDYFCDIHLDLIAQGGTISSTEWLGETIDLSQPVDDGTPHPDGVNDEDIDGDCCSLSFEQCAFLANPEG